MKRSTQNLWILFAVVLLTVIPLLFVNGEFGGADGEAEELIGTLAPSYEPWFSPWFEPPAETESMLFALQAAIGAGMIGYVFGLLRGRSSKEGSAGKAASSGTAVTGKGSKKRQDSVPGSS